LARLLQKKRQGSRWLYYLQNIKKAPINAKNSTPTGGDGLEGGLQWTEWPETDMAGPIKIQDGVPGVPGLWGGLVGLELQPTPGFKSKKNK